MSFFIKWTQFFISMNILIKGRIYTPESTSTLTLCEFTYHDVISVLIPVFNSQSVIIGFGSDDGDGHDDNDDDDENYENLSGLEWFALQRTLMLNSTGFHTGFKLFL